VARKGSGGLLAIARADDLFLIFFVSFLIKQKRKEAIYETDNILLLLIFAPETDYQSIVI
jgi:hypothetical protein